MSNRTLALLAPLVVGLALASASCGTKADATLSVYAQNLVLTKTAGGAFGPNLEGTVDVVCDLGHWAQGPVTVTNVGVRLLRDGQPVLVRADIVPLAPLPVTVQPSSAKTLTYSIKATQLSNAEVTELCAGPIGVSGSVTVDAESGQTTIGATPVMPAGCP